MQIVQDNPETIYSRLLILETLRAAPGKRFRLDAIATILGTGIASVRALMSQMVIENHIRSEREGRVVYYFAPTAAQLEAERIHAQKARPFKPYKPDPLLRQNQERAMAVRALGGSKF